MWRPAGLGPSSGASPPPSGSWVTRSPTGPNGDEDRYDLVGLASFTKALPHHHHHLGEVDPGAYRALLRALRSGRSQDFRRVRLGGRVKLANPEGAFSFERQGPDPWQRPLPPPALASEAFAAEMTEGSWLALARDLPCPRYGQEPITAAAIADLGAFPTTKAWTPAPCSAATSLGVATGPTAPSSCCSPPPWALPPSSSGTGPPWPAATT